MQLTFELEGGNFSKAGYASSQIKKILKQLSIDSRVIKRVVVALYEAEVNVVAHAWRGKVAAELDADELTIESEVGVGTIVRMVTWFRKKE